MDAFADVSGAPRDRTAVTRWDAVSNEDPLLGPLDEIIYVLDAEGASPRTSKSRRAGTFPRT